MDERPWVFGEYQNEYFAYEFQTKTIYLCISVIFPFRFHQINYVSMEFVRPRWADKIDKCVCRSNFLWVFVRRPFCRSTWLVRTCDIRIQRVIHTISPYDEPLFIPTMLLFLFVFYVIYAFVSATHFDSYNIYMNIWIPPQFHDTCAKSWKLWSWHERTQTPRIAVADIQKKKKKHELSRRQFCSQSYAMNG